MPCRQAALVGAVLTCRQYATRSGRGITITCVRASDGPVPWDYSGPAGSEEQFHNLRASATSVAAHTSADAP